jgi:PPM family protein phosphatase
MMNLKCAAGSDPGRVRTNNEDRVHCDPDRGIFLIVDGIGGHAAGEHAADIAVQTLRMRLERPTGTVEQRVREAIALANDEILRAAGTRPEWGGMACVLTVAVLEDTHLTIGHVGDSRLYKLRNGSIDKLTHDHSPVGEREDNQEIPELEAMQHPRRNEVFRDVGSEPHDPYDPEFIEVISAPFEDDSAILICSDGLSDQVTSGNIRRIIEENSGKPDEAVHELITAANDAGGKDNVSALLLEGARFAEVPATSDSFQLWLLGRPAMFVYGAILAALLMWFLRPTPKLTPAAPRTLTVSSGTEFPTISSAIAQAKAGDTVEVMPGEYREQLRLKEGVLVKSSRPREALLRGIPGLTPSAIVVAEHINTGVLEGFRIGDGTPMLGLLVSDSNVTVEDNEFTSLQAGIEIQGSSRALVKANTIRNCTYQGVIVGGPAAPHIEQNVITGNGRAAGQQRPGITVLSEATPVLRGNVFGGNGGGGVSLPAEADVNDVAGSNFFFNGDKVSRTQPGIVGGRPHQ